MKPKPKKKSKDFVFVEDLRQRLVFRGRPIHRSAMDNQLKRLAIVKWKEKQPNWPYPQMVVSAEDAALVEKIFRARHGLLGKNDE